MFIYMLQTVYNISDKSQGIWHRQIFQKGMDDFASLHQVKNMGKNYNGNWKKWKIISIVVVLFIISAITASAFICKHESVDYVITIEPTCTEKGEGRFICND